LIEFVMMTSWDVSAVVVIGNEVKLGALGAGKLAVCSLWHCFQF
jgi:hypothetical protein